MNKFSNDGSFLDMFKQMNGNTSNIPQSSNISKTVSLGSSSKNSLSRAFKQMSQDKVFSKPKVVYEDRANEDQSSSKSQITEFFEVKDEYNEYDATLPDSYDEPVTKLTYEVIDKLIESVVEFGDDMERIIFNDQKDNPEFWFLHDKKSDTYRFYQKKLGEAKRKKLEPKFKSSTVDPELKSEVKMIKDEVPVLSIESLDVPQVASTPASVFDTPGSSKWDVADDELQAAEKSRKRKSRWGPETKSVPLNDGAVVTLNDDDFDMLIAMEELKRAEQAAKRKKMALSLAQGVTYNSDDDDAEANGGTKEHLMRKQEMERTEAKAKEQTQVNEGRTFIGDFIPKEELMKFNAQVAKAKGMPMTPEMAALSDTSNFADKKLKEDNIGFKMLKKAGWSEGSGLGTMAQGVTAPVDVNPNGGTMGLGMFQQLNQVSSSDDDVEIFRKRMMMAYKYRPNPLNNPRRPYY